MNRIEKFRRGFKDIFDSHGKFKKWYVENVEALALKNDKDCKECKHYENRFDVFSRCNGCKFKYVDLWEGKK